MNRRSHLRCAFVAAALGAACHATGGGVAAAPSPERFADPEHIAVSVDSTQVPRSRRGVAPVYPMEARMAGEEGRVIALFVIDTTGTPEPRTITLLTPPNPALDRAVCGYVEASRYDWSSRLAQRVLVIVPIEFTVEGGRGLPPRPDLRELARQLRALPRTELVARLNAARHCD